MFRNSRDASNFLSKCPCFAQDTPPHWHQGFRTQGRTIGSKYFAQRATSLAQHFNIPNASKLQNEDPKMPPLVGPSDQIVPNRSQHWNVETMGLFEASESLTMRIANRRSQRAGSRTSQQPAVRPFHYHSCPIFLKLLKGNCREKPSFKPWLKWQKTSRTWGKIHFEPHVTQNLDASQPANWTNTKPEINDRRADGVNRQTWHLKTGGDKTMGTTATTVQSKAMSATPWRIDTTVISSHWWRSIFGHICLKKHRSTVAPWVFQRQRRFQTEAYKGRRPVVVGSTCFWNKTLPGAGTVSWTCRQWNPTHSSLSVGLLRCLRNFGDD